jgi:hypothetical protein
MAKSQDAQKSEKKKPLKTAKEKKQAKQEKKKGWKRKVAMMPSPASLNHRGTKNLLSGPGAIDPEVTLLQLVINYLIHPVRLLTRRCFQQALLPGSDIQTKARNINDYMW